MAVTLALVNLFTLRLLLGVKKQLDTDPELKQETAPKSPPQA